MIRSDSPIIDLLGSCGSVVVGLGTVVVVVVFSETDEDLFSL